MTFDSVSHWLAAVSAAHWSIVVMLACMVALFAWFNRESGRAKDNGFDFVDAFKDDVTGKASATKCLMWMASILATWQIMFGTFRGQDMTGLTRDFLGALILGKVGSAWASRPAAVPPAIAAPGSDIKIETAPAPVAAPVAAPAPMRKRGRVDAPAGE